MYADQDRLNEVFSTSSQKLCRSLQKFSGNDPLPVHCTQLSEVLGPVPRYLGGASPSKVKKLLTNTGIYFYGTSTFRVAHGNCDAKPKVIDSQLKLATKHPTSFRGSNKLKVERWFPGCHENLITVMILAWSYILSSCWSETIQQYDPTLTCEVQCISTASPEESDNFEKAGLSDPTWWRMVTSGSWCASFILDGTTFHSPWALKPQSVLASPHTSAKKDHLPSSEQALRYLEELCSIYGVEQPCLAALSTALFIPLLQEKGLSLPSINFALPPPSGSPAPTEKILQQLDLLPYYMTLSSDPWGLRALLQGVFYTDTVSCNELRAWMLPIIDTIDILINNQNTHEIGFLLADRAPRMAPLWIGALLAGSLEFIVEPTRLGLFAVSLPAAAWTGTRHSFIGPFQHPRSILCRDEKLDRADEAILIYLAQDVRLPTSPWKPFGETTVGDTDLVVREHLDCGSHSLQYSHWSLDPQAHRDPGFAVPSLAQACPAADGWLHDDGSHSLDTGTPIQVYIADDEDMSRNATKNIFGWMRRDGWPPNERQIHEWTKDDTDEDEDIGQDCSPITSVHSC